MKQPSQIFGLFLIVLACALLVAERVLSAVTPLWVDFLLIGLGAVCLIGAIGMAQSNATPADSPNESNSHDAKE